MLPSLIAVLYICILLWLIAVPFILRRHMNQMNGMMVAMTLGMVIGLSCGVILGVFLPDRYFEITVVSILTGGLLGSLAGIPIHVAAVLDGLLSGIMGGMMGAMLGVMVPESYKVVTIQVVAAISVTALFILYLLCLEQIHDQDRNGEKWLKLSPLPLFVFILVFLFLTSQLHLDAFSPTEPVPIEQHDYYRH